MTEAGKALYKYALQMTQLMEEAKLEVREVGNGVNGRLTIGINTFSVDGLPDILHRFKELYPKVTYKIQQNESSHLCKLVEERIVELAIIRLPLELEHFSVLHLHSEPFYFITSAQRPLQDREEVSLADIHACPLILPSTEGLGVHYSIIEAFSRHQLQPNLIGECSDIPLLLDLVTSEFAASIVPETVLRRHSGYPIQAYEITGNGLSTSVGLIWNKHHYLSKAAQNFVDMLREGIS
jgi:DNA-binding transcriptional LysR family regulator